MSQLPPLGVDPALNVPSTVLFCPYSGSLLQIDEHEGLAKSALTGYSVRLQEVKSRLETKEESNMVEYARRYHLDMLVKPEDEVEKEEAVRTRATVEERCPDCDHLGLEYYTMQLRSADEGQTVFYECPECGHKHSTNN